MKIFIDCVYSHFWCLLQFEWPFLNRSDCTRWTRGHSCQHLCSPTLYWKPLLMSLEFSLFHTGTFSHCRPVVAGYIRVLLPRCLVDRLLPCCRIIVLLLCYFPLCFTDFWHISVILVLMISLLLLYPLNFFLATCITTFIILVMSLIKTLNMISPKTIYKIQKLKFPFLNACKVSINESYSAKCFGWYIKIFLPIQTQ